MDQRGLAGGASASYDDGYDENWRAGYDTDEYDADQHDGLLDADEENDEDADARWTP